MPELCNELNAITDIKTEKEHVCEECVKTGNHWVHLRTCQECGVTLCCDSSPNKHMTKHYHRTNHPVASSAEPGERWLWCYVHKQIAEY